MPHPRPTPLPPHPAKPARPKPPARTTTQQGLGWAHAQRRAQLLPAALGTMCPGPWTGPRSKRCTGIMVNPHRMHLDDRIPRALGGTTTTTGGRICCAPCNCSHGARLGNRLRTRRPQPPPRPLPQW